MDKTKSITYVLLLGIFFFILSLVIAVLLSYEPQLYCPPCQCSNPPCACPMVCLIPSVLDLLTHALLPEVYGVYAIIAVLSYLVSLKIGKKNKPKLLILAKSLIIGALIGFCFIILAPSVIGIMLKLVAFVLKPSLAKELETPLL